MPLNRVIKGAYLEAETEQRTVGYGGAISGSEILGISENKMTVVAYYYPSEPISDGM